jgi:hypothetical protein
VDGQNIFIKEFKFYYKLQNNEKFEIIKQIIQYSDFSIWQKQIFEIIEKQKKYYFEKFKNFSKSLNISFENIETKSINNGNSISFLINEKKSNQLKIYQKN